MGEEGVVLEYHPDVALVRRHVVDGPAVEQDPAMGRNLEAGQHQKGGGLARARGPQHRQELASRDVHVQAFDDQRLAVVALLDVDEFDESVSASRHTLRSASPCPAGSLSALMGKGAGRAKSMSKG